MTISYPLSIPGTRFREFSLKPINATFRMQSPFSFAQDAQDWGGRAWQADAMLPPQSLSQARSWEAFFASLKGSYGTFLMGDCMASTPAGSAGGTPLVAGGGQTGEALDIDGAAINQTGWLLAGDYIQLGTGSSSRLYRVLADVDTNGSGAATIDIWPSLRSSPSDNATVIVSNTVGLFAMTDHSVRARSDGAYDVSFSALEAL